MVTFEKRVTRRWWGATLSAVAGYATVLLMTVMVLHYAVFAVLVQSPGESRMMVAVALILVTFAFGLGWGFRGIYVSSIDVIVRDMGPLQRRMLVAAIQEELSPVREESTKTK